MLRKNLRHLHSTCMHRFQRFAKTFPKKIEPQRLLMHMQRFNFRYVPGDEVFSSCPREFLRCRRGRRLARPVPPAECGRCGGSPWRISGWTTTSAKQKVKLRVIMLRAYSSASTIFTFLSDILDILEMGVMASGCGGELSRHPPAFPSSDDAAAASAEDDGGLMGEDIMLRCCCSWWFSLSFPDSSTSSSSSSLLDST